VSWEAYYTFFIIGAVFLGLVRNVAPPYILLMGGAVVVTLPGVVSVDQFLSGFSNHGMLTVGAMFVVAAAMKETGALDRLGAWVLGRARTEASVLRRMAMTVTTMSAFMNNTPLVAMFMPVISSWCKSHRVSPSRLLLPLSYMAILGGTCTLIGTSTNLIVNGMMVEEAATLEAGARVLLEEAPQSLEAAAVLRERAGDFAGMSFFELGYVGIPYAIIGCLYLYFVGRRLLPERKDLLEKLGESSREYLANMQIQPGCPLVGQQVEEAGLRHLPGLFLIEIVRGSEVIAPVGPKQILQADDVLTFTGVVTTIVDLERVPGFVPVADAGYETRAAERRGNMLCEAVVSNTSPLIGKTIRAAQFRGTYNAAVVAVHRGGERLMGRVGDIVLQAGDTLLLQTGPNFDLAHRNNPDFFLVSGVEDSRSVRHERSLTSLALLVLLVVLMTTGVVPVVMAAFFVAGLMVVTRCISSGVALHSIDWQTLLTIAGSLALGKALENSGCAAIIADFIVNRAGAFGPLVVLALVYLLTATFTEFITNNAAAVIVFPFAVAISADLGVSPRPFIMAITFAASASLITPLGYQTNLMVYGPGGYKFTDFVRVGLPLSLLLFATAVLLIPKVWPF
jgi:di/tricarboxylate transporter